MVAFMRTGLIDLISRYRRRLGRAWRAWRIEYAAETFVQSDSLVARHPQSGGDDYARGAVGAADGSVHSSERDAHNVLDTYAVNGPIREGHRNFVGVNNFELLRGNRSFGS